MIINRLSDVFIRYLLGNEHNKDILISFINAHHEWGRLDCVAYKIIKRNWKKVSWEKK